MSDLPLEPQIRIVRTIVKSFDSVVEMTFGSSLLRLINFGRPAETPDEKERLGRERVRLHMLKLLATSKDIECDGLAARIRYADEIESLWYLRQDLVAALSEANGEMAARREVAPLNALFHGHLPSAMTAPPPRQHIFR